MLTVYVIVMLIGRAFSHGRRGRLPLAYGRAILRDPTAILAGLAGALAVALPVLEGVQKDSSFRHSSCVGLALILVGHGVVYTANSALGANWSPTIEKTEGHQLVTGGIYGVIRHPLYLAGLLITVGTNVYFASSWSWIALLPVLAVLWIRIPMEEKQLVARFGERYTGYRKKTKAILPWLL
mgnify:FL=1